MDVLQIDPKCIEKGKPWENLIESQFKIQLRLADYKFEQAHTLTEIQDQHAEFIQTFNYTPHWEHRFREDGRCSPAQVLGWVRRRMVNPNELLNLFQQVHFSRVVNRFGFVSVLRFYLYAEQGLSRQRVSIWIYEGSLHIEYQDTMLAQYQVDYDERQKRLKDISPPTLYQTPFASPQMVLFELDDEQWLKIRRRSYLKRQKRLVEVAEQLALFRLDVAVWVLFYFGGYELVGFFFPNSGHVFVNRSTAKGGQIGLVAKCIEALLFLSRKGCFFLFGQYC